MIIECKDIAKKYRKELLFSQFNYTFQDNNKYAILGFNSAGKSTLLKVIAGLVEPSKGEVSFDLAGNEIAETDKHEYFSFSSPELQLFKDLLVQDIVDFHFKFKQAKVELNEFWKITELKAFRNKQYSELSSGLKNKLKLSLALFSKTDVLLLDEPCTNFDEKNTTWYQECIAKYCEDQMIIVASNQAEEYAFCEKKINLIDYKK